MSSPGRARLGTNSRIWMTSSKTANSRGWARTRAAINWSRTSCCGDRATADLRPPGGIEDLRWQLLQQRCGAHRRAHRRLPRPGRTRAALHRPPGLSRCMESVTKQRELAEVGGPACAIARVSVAVGRTGTASTRRPSLVADALPGLDSEGVRLIEGEGGGTCRPS